MDVLVVYDIATDKKADAKRLRSVAKVCEGYGVRVQDSVFECRLSEVTKAELWYALSEIIDHDRDAVYLYRFAGSVSSARETLGLPTARNPEDPWIF